MPCLSHESYFCFFFLEPDKVTVSEIDTSSGVSKTSIALSWTEVTGANKYIVSYNDQEGQESDSSTGHTLNNLESGVEYTINVVAKIDDLEGEASDDVIQYTSE